MKGHGVWLSVMPRRKPVVSMLRSASGFFTPFSACVLARRAFFGGESGPEGRGSNKTTQRNQMKTM